MKKSKTLGILLIIFILFMSTTLAQAMYQKTSTSTLQKIKDTREIIVGVASWYSKESPGIRPTTANMEIFDDTDMTCAMWGVPFNQHLKITNLSNGKSVTVRVNDRGPHKRFVEQGRVVDLSKAAFAKIAPLHEGLVQVKVELM